MAGHVLKAHDADGNGKVGTWGCSLGCMGLQSRMHRVEAFDAWGYPTLTLTWTPSLTPTLALTLTGMAEL